MILAINYSDENFEKQRKYNTKTAYSKGKVDNVIEYSPDDIDPQFKEQNKNIFAYKRGAGLWLWKPYIILKTLTQIKEGDYLFYCDSGVYYVNDIMYLINNIEKSNQSIMGFELPLLERQFTKKEAFDLMDYNNYNNNQILATYLLVKKDNFSLKFIQEWLLFACDERIISGNKFIFEIEEFKDFLVHREDQSIFSILYHKYNLEAFKEPTQYGDRPWEHLWIPEYTWSKPWKYKFNPKTNSDFPRILVGYRQADPWKYRRKEAIKSFFHKIGLYNEKVYRIIKNAKNA